MTATRCAVVVFRSVIRGSCVGSMVAEWFSLHEWLIFQSVSMNISLQLEEELKREVCYSLEADGGTLPSSEWDDIATEIRGNAVSFSQG